MKDKEHIEIEIELSDEVFIELARLAHQRDMTLNNLVLEILSEELEKSNA